MAVAQNNQPTANDDREVRVQRLQAELAELHEESVSFARETPTDQRDADFVVRMAQMWQRMDDIAIALDDLLVQPA